ncbi:MAG: hypothetical protein H6728_00050 [Myxococcales bacterium]|nr:hypothetical protein [Myxococcales bacterium]
MSSTLAKEASYKRLTLDQSFSDWWPSSASWVESMVSMINAGEIEGLHPIFSGLGVPALDLLVTPMSARIGLWSAGEGRGFFHHELRGAIGMPEGLEPERSVWEEGTVPVWDAGVRGEPKYFSFFQEAPLAPYNPNYRRKWRSHELLHGLLRFYWNPQMSRFGLYLSARLNELLPVVHWYGWDEAFRPRCEVHRHQGPLRGYCAACEQAGHPYWEREAGWESQGWREDAVRWAEAAREHFFAEWAVCLRELESGRRIESPRGYLDASSDALGYVYGHWPRLTAWSFGSWVELFLVDGADFFSTVSSLMEHHLFVASELLRGDLEVETSRCEEMKQRRLLQDLGYRTLLALEWFKEGSVQAQRAERILWPVLESMGSHCRALLDGTSDLAAGVPLFAAWKEAVQAAIPAKLSGLGERALTLGATGILWPRTEAITGSSQEAWSENSIQHVREGLESVGSWLFLLPQLTEKGGLLGEEGLKQFALSDAFGEHGRLMTRWSRWLQEQEQAPATLREMVRFMGWSQEEPRKDAEAEDFGALPEEADELLDASGCLRVHQTLRRATWSGWLVEEVLGERPEAETQEEMDALLCARFQAAASKADEAQDAESIAVIYHGGAMKVLPLEEMMEEVLAAVETGAPLASWLDEERGRVLSFLLEESFVVWLPSAL